MVGEVEGAGAVGVSEAVGAKAKTTTTNEAANQAVSFISTANLLSITTTIFQFTILFNATHDANTANDYVTGTGNGKSSCHAAEFNESAAVSGVTGGND